MITHKLYMRLRDEFPEDYQEEVLAWPGARLMANEAALDRIPSPPVSKGQEVQRAALLCEGAAIQAELAMLLVRPLLDRASADAEAAYAELEAAGKD